MALVLLCAACGGDAAAPTEVSDGPPTPRPTAIGASSASRVVLTEQSAGTTVRVRVGEQVVVELPADASGGYVAPVSDGAALERSSTRGGYPSGQPVVAVFAAIGAGAVNLTSTTDYACLHSEPRCLLPQRQWSVRVVVAAR